MWEYLDLRGLSGKTWVAQINLEEAAKCRNDSDLPELLADRGRRRDCAFPPSGDVIEAREHEKRRQRDPSVERSRFCIRR
jgi:hypothetical protein